MEKTCAGCQRPTDPRKHLHGRGEDRSTKSLIVAKPETPPRTWRRQQPRTLSLRRRGNTSTDVEKTYPIAMKKPPNWKHLHGRGEDSQTTPNIHLRLETPPRTWRRPSHLMLTVDACGNTSTDVEKTHTFLLQCGQVEKHLHGRGEDAKRPVHWHSRGETPPRTWRRRLRAS